MLLKLIENNKQIDEVIYFDTGMEFGCIYNIRNQIEQLLKGKNIPFTVLNGHDFLDRMLDHEINHRDGTKSCGYKWCGGKCRWYTSEKTSAIRKYLKNKYGKGNY